MEFNQDIKITSQEIYNRVISKWIHHYGKPSQKKAIEYKNKLIEENKLSLCNLFINIVNKHYGYQLKRIKGVERKTNGLIYDYDLELVLKFLKKNSPQTYSFCLLILSTGLRKNEALGLYRQNILNAIQIRKLVILGKGNKERVIYLTKDNIHNLFRVLKENKNELMLFKRNYEAYYKHFKKALKTVSMSKKSKMLEIDQKGVGFHSLRRKYACNLDIFLEKQEIPFFRRVDIIKKNLGHSSIDTTINYLRSSQKEIESIFLR